MLEGSAALDDHTRIMNERDTYRTSTDVTIPEQPAGELDDAVEEFTQAETIESVGQTDTVQVTVSVIGTNHFDAAVRARNLLQAQLEAGCYDKHTLHQTTVFGPNDSTRHFGT